MQRELSRHSPLKLFGCTRAALHLFVICAIWIVIWSPRDLASEGPGLALSALASRPGNDRVLESIRERGKAIYRNYAGVRSIRHSAIRVYDGGSGELLERVEPRRNGRRYFRGDMYFAKHNLALRSIAGTFARLQFGLRDFYFEFLFSGRGPAPVFERGFARGTVHVPLILHKSFTSRMVFEKQTLVRR